MNNIKWILAGVSAVFISLSSAHAGAYTSEINISGGYAIYNFSGNIPGPLSEVRPDLDANPFTYNIDLNNIVGLATISVPPAGNYNWFIEGGAGAIGGVFPIGFSTPNTQFASGPWNPTGFSGTNYSFDFNNQVYSATSGTFGVPYNNLSDLINGLIPGPGPLASGIGSGIMNITYSIIAADLDGIVNDIRMSVIELPIDPLVSFSGAFNMFDIMPGAQVNGRLDGQFKVGLTITAVDEPAPMALLALGMVGFGLIRRRKQILIKS